MCDQAQGPGAACNSSDASCDAGSNREKLEQMEEENERRDNQAHDRKHGHRDHKKDRGPATSNTTWVFLWNSSWRPRRSRRTRQNLKSPSGLKK